jgi:hypothetical protein
MEVIDMLRGEISVLKNSSEEYAKEQNKKVVCLIQTAISADDNSSSKLFFGTTKTGIQCIAMVAKRICQG